MIKSCYSPHKKVFTAECAEIKLGFAENRRVLFSYFFRRAGFVLNVELDLQSSSLLLLGFPIRYLFIFLCIILVLFILRIKSSAWRLHSKNPYSNYEVDCKSTSTESISSLLLNLIVVGMEGLFGLGRRLL